MRANRSNLFLFPLVPFLFLLAFPTISHADITTGLVGLWKFDDGSGTSAVDSSGHGNTGTLTNAGGGLPSWQTPGKIGPAAIGFGGNNDFVSIDLTGLGMNISEMTISWWTNLTAGAQWRDWWGLNTATGTYGAEHTGNNGFTQVGNPALYNFSGNSGAGSVQVNSDYHVDNTGWRLITATMSLSANQVNLYLDGVLIGSSTWSANDAVTTLFIGEHGFGSSLANITDDFRIYNRALSSTDVTQLYNYTGVGFGLTSSLIRNGRIAGLHHSAQ